MVMNARVSRLTAQSRSSDLTAALIGAIQGGLPLVERPYAAIAQALGLDESAVIARLRELLEEGAIKRLGVVVRHRELGYRANAMVVWDLPDGEVDELGARIGTIPFVTLCYRRPRRLPEWPYNLFTMIHGRSREAVLGQVAELQRSLGRGPIPHAVLFSGQRFKQRGALYRGTEAALAPESLGGSRKRLGNARPATLPLSGVPILSAPLEQGDCP
jgi:DNA-binding Lrp family transcriptional regulator